MGFSVSNNTKDQNFHVSSSIAQSIQYNTSEWRQNGFKILGNTSYSNINTSERHCAKFHTYSQNEQLDPLTALL